MDAGRCGRTATRSRGGGPQPTPNQLVEEFAPGRSFVDIGCMWNVHGGIAFHAEESGARTVTGVDLVAPTARFLEERERRQSTIRFVQGDMNDPAVLGEIGRHDVVWCSGVLYHLPDPVRSLTQLKSVVGEHLLLGTASLPEIPGLANVCVFYPGLPASQRRMYDPPGNIPGALRHGLSNDFDASRDLGYGNWWWGFTPSAIRSMLEVAGYRVRRMHSVAVGGAYTTYVVAQPA